MWSSLSLLILLRTFETVASEEVLRTINLVGKSARHKKTYEFKHFYPADLAINGNSDQTITNSQCSHGHDNSYWWICDMANFYVVRKVAVIGRNDYTQRLDYFIVGISSHGYGGGDVIRGSYPICGQYPHQAKKHDWMEVKCKQPFPASKFLIIQQPITGEGYITICEVKAFTYQSKRHRWKRVNGFYQEGRKLDKTKVGNDMECLMRCLQLLSCFYANVGPWKTCILMGENQNNTAILSSKWKFFMVY